jgi:hypothetical protein
MSAFWEKQKAQVGKSRRTRSKMTRSGHAHLGVVAAQLLLEACFGYGDFLI